MDLVYPREITLFRIAIVISVIVWLLLIVGSLGIALLYIGIFFLIALFAQAAFISHIKGNGVEVTAEQYPDLHRQLVACCDKVGVAEIPQTYLLRTDFFNALATRFLRRHYVVLFTDVVDALQERPGGVAFYIGHELGHIHRKHIRWGWVLAPALWLPILGAAYRRAEEYTCDRYGSACVAEDADAVAALATIVAGDTRWQDINLPAYQRQVDDTGGFFMSLNEFTNDYPWMCKRMAWITALRAGEEPTFPRRSLFAKLLIPFIPRIPGGFVSLLLLVSIVGILAAVALPAYQDYIRNANAAKAAAEASQNSQNYANSEIATPEYLSSVLAGTGDLRDAVEAYYTQNAGLPQDPSELVMSDAQRNALGAFDTAISVYEDGVIAATIDENEDAYFVIEPSVSEEGEFIWYCYGQNLSEESLPQECL